MDMQNPIPMSRREDLRLVTGNGRYSADWNLPGQLHAAFLRADRAHAEILGLDVSRALDRKGVRAVLTGEDVREAGFKSLPNALNYPGKGGQKIRKVHHPVLALGRVRYVGEPIAMIVADTAAIADDARELIDIEYRDLPAVSTYEDAVATNAQHLHDEVPGNLAFEFESGDPDATRTAFAGARYVSRLTVDSQRLVGNMLEPRAFLVAFDQTSGCYTLHIPMQGVGTMQAQLAYVTGVDKNHIVPVAQDVGGSFGIRGSAYPEYFAGMIAAHKLGRPIKWVATRAETFMSDCHGRALSLTGELALDAEGRFLAIRWDDRADLGAYGGSFGSVVATNNITITMGGVYHIPAMYTVSRLAYTNTVPVSAYRGAGRPDIAYAIERLVDYTAHEHGFDPIELRRKNFIPPEAMPYKTPNAGTYDSGHFLAVMEDAIDRADYGGFPDRRAASELAGKLRGIGIATYLEAGGGGFAPKDQVAVEFDAYGEMKLSALTQSSGQGHETVFPQIVAQTLGISTDRILFDPAPASANLVGNGTGGSRGVLGTGSAFKLLAEKLIEVAKPYAAEKLGAAESELTYGDGAFHVARPSSAADNDAARLIRFVDLARALAGPKPHPLSSTAEGTFGVTYPNGCHIAEVEIDPETGSATIARYTAVDDLGKVINPQLVAGQVHGGVAQGAGQVFGEHAVYDRETGQLVTASFADYFMPRAGLLRSIEVHEHSVPTLTNAIGAKGVGEAGCSGSLPALMNAVMDALRPFGLKHLQMPLTPPRIWAAIHATSQEHS